MAKNRFSNIELLRIILMITIVFYHLIVHAYKGIFVQFFPYQPLEVSYYESIILTIGMIPVDCFLIITGFWGLNIIDDQNKIKWKKIIRVYIPIFFYSVLIGLIFFIRGRIGIVPFLRSFFPVINSDLWFASCYVVLLLCSPILNILFSNYLTNIKAFVCFIFIGIIVYFLNDTKFSILYGTGANRFFIFIYCYLIGRYINYIKDNEHFKFLSKFSLLFFILLYFFVGLIIFIIYKYFNRNIWYRLSVNNSPITLLGASLFFLTFYNMRCRNNFLINLYGRSSFPVYLITENTNLRKPLYSFINSHYIISNSDMLNLLIYSLIIFFVCSSIDMALRQIISFFGVLYDKNNSKITKN